MPATSSFPEGIASCTWSIDISRNPIYALLVRLLLGFDRTGGSAALGAKGCAPTNLRSDMGSLIKKRRKRMRKKKHKKMLKATRWQRRAAGK